MGVVGGAVGLLGWVVVVLSPGVGVCEGGGCNPESTGTVSVVLSPGSAGPAAA